MICSDIREGIKHTTRGEEKKRNNQIVRVDGLISLYPRIASEHVTELFYYLQHENVVSHRGIAGSNSFWRPLYGPRISTDLEKFIAIRRIYRQIWLTLFTSLLPNSQV